MTKAFNKVIALIAALCVLVCAGALVACGDDGVDTDSVTYTVTVKTGENSPAGGVKVGVGVGSASFGSKTTDSNGKAEFQLASGTYNVTLSNLPPLYQVPSSTELKLSPESPDLTVVLEEAFAYRVSLVNPDNTPFYAAGVSVGVCTLTDNCLEPVEIGSDGVAKIAVPKTDYHVQVLNLPDGYAYVCDEHNYAGHMDASNNLTLELLTAQVTELTITIHPVNEIDPAKLEKLSAAEIEDYRQNKRLSIDGYAAYKLTADVAAGATEYFVFTPDMEGEYKFFSPDGNSIAYKLNEVFLLGDSYLKGSGFFVKSGHAAHFNAGSSYYLNVTNSGRQAVKAEFVLSVPAASDVTASALGNVNVKFNTADATAHIVLVPPVQGKYKATVQGDALAYIQTVANSGQDISPAASDYVAGSSAEAKAAGNYTNVINRDGDYTSVCFAVKIKDAAQPLTLSVKLEKTADITNTVNVIEPQAELAVYDKTAAQNERLVPVAMDGSVQIVEGDDGNYHVGDKNGPVAVVLLTRPINDAARFGLSGSLVYLELANQTASSVSLGYIADITPEADKAVASDKGNTYNDYRLFLRGFNDYDSAPNMQGGYTLSVPERKDVDEYYAKYVNADGVYPLTAELKSFLQVFADINSWNIRGAADGCEWYFACYYYAVSAVESDAIVGEYNFVRMTDVLGNSVAVGDRVPAGDDERVIGDNEYMLVISDNGRFTISALNNGDYVMSQSGAWTKNGDVYTFTVPDGTTDGDNQTADLHYSVTYNAATGAIELVGDDTSAWSFVKK